MIHYDPRRLLLPRRSVLPIVKSTLLVTVALIAWSVTGCATRSGTDVRHTDQVVDLSRNGKPVLTYHLEPPSNSGLPVQAGGYFHPLRTPNGIAVTDFAPSDHKHHRGLFLAWVEMHGARDADFWGWGAHAPIRNRRIVNRSVAVTSDGFVARNDWVAEDIVIIEEKLTARSTTKDGLNVLDLNYELTSPDGVILSRWAFSGFSLRGRKDGDIRISSPTGLAALPNPSHVKPESNWPDAPWYASEQTLTNGVQIGAAVMSHPSNPPTLWHNHRDMRMINPCIVAPGEVKLAARKTLVLRYRVVTFDGALPASTLNALAKEWR